ncbi:MAG: hypothetical protein ACREQV_10445, partial [Candidatus Binatia bacterium]
SVIRSRSDRRLKLSAILLRKVHGQIIPLHVTKVKLNTFIYTSSSCWRTTLVHVVFQPDLLPVFVSCHTLHGAVM